MARESRTPRAPARERRNFDTRSGTVKGGVSTLGDLSVTGDLTVSGDLTVTGDMTVRGIYLFAYTDGTRPTAVGNAGLLIYNTSEPTNPQLNFSDGANWFDIAGVIT